MIKTSIKSIINIIETYNPEVVRKSIPYYFLLNWISSFKTTKVLLSGDVMNIHGGKREFQNVENDDEFQELNVELINNLCKTDLVRTERLSSAFGLEIRHPYLDISVIDLFLNMCPYYKKNNKYKADAEIDKYYLRNCFKEYFDESGNDILWNKKENTELQNIISEMQEYYSRNYSDEYYEKYVSDINRWKHFVVPKNKEEMAYQLIYNGLFPNRGKLN